MSAAISIQTRVTLAEAQRILAECEANYHRGTERFALANTIVSLHQACAAWEENDALQQEEIARLQRRIDDLEGVVR